MNEAAIQFDVPVTMRDGVVLRADVYRPAGDGPWPVLLQRTPYLKGSPANLNLLDTMIAVRRGYIVVQQDVRGRFASDGTWKPWVHEHADGYDTVAWAARLPGSNGTVGMFGASYTGNTQWSAASGRPPALRAIAPMVTWCDPSDGLHQRGGALELGLNTWWALQVALGQIPKAAANLEEMQTRMYGAMSDYDRLATETYWELPAGAHPPLARLAQPDLGLEEQLREPGADTPARVRGRHGEVTVPALNIGGWYDVFQQGTIDNYLAAKEAGLTTRLVMGPWTHTNFGGGFSWQIGDVNFGLSAFGPPSADGTMTTMLLDWYDRHLAASPSGSEASDEGVDLFVMGINQWRHEETWPLERARDTSFYLHAGGALSTEPPTDDESSTTFVYDPADPVPTTGGAMVMAFDHPAGPFDQRDVESRDDVVTFTTEPLAEDTEITGRVSATLFAATDGPSTDWVVRLCDVHPDGTSLNVVDGIRRVTTEPGRVDEVTVDLWSTSIVIRAGHRIRVQVTSSNFPRWDRNLNTGEPVTEGTTWRVAQQEIVHAAGRLSHVVLPLVPGD